MNDSIYQEIEDNPRFQELVEKTQPLCLAVVINHLNDVCRFHFSYCFRTTMARYSDIYRLECHSWYSCGRGINCYFFYSYRYLCYPR